MLRGLSPRLVGLCAVHGYQQWPPDMPKGTGPWPVLSPAAVLRYCSARRDLAYQQDNVGLQYAAKQEAIGRKARQHDPAYGNNVGPC